MISINASFVQALVHKLILKYCYNLIILVQVSLWAAKDTNKMKMSVNTGQLWMVKAMVSFG